MSRWLVIGVTLVLAATTAAVWLSTDTKPCSDDTAPTYTLFAPDELPTRNLRGDWEAPDAVAVAYSPAWPDAVADLISLASNEAQVELLADPETVDEDTLTSWLDENTLSSPGLHVRWEQLDTPWLRDFGPLQVTEKDGGLVWLDSHYSDERPNDDRIPEALGPALGVFVEPIDLDLDGGALISSGTGLCVSTLDYFADQGIDLDSDLLRNTLLVQLGCRVLALVPALVHEGTHHADMLAQFLDPSVVAVASVDVAESPDDAERMDVAAQAIEEAAAYLDQEMEVVRVPLPYLGAGHYRTYLNGLRLNSAFVVPRYADVDDAREADVYRVLADALPGVKLVPVPADAIIAHGGALHCIALGLTLPPASGLALHHVGAPARL